MRIMTYLSFRAFVSVEAEESIKIQIANDYSGINCVKKELVDGHHLKGSNRPNLNEMTVSEKNELQDISDFTPSGW